MDLEIAGRSALAFGGSKGPELACARHLAKAGAKVCIAARTEAALQAASDPLSRGLGNNVDWVVPDIRA